MESWHTYSVEARESALILRRFVVHGAFLELLCRNWCSSRLETGVSGNLLSCLKEGKALVVYDVEHGLTLDPMQANRASPRVDFRYTEQFHVPAVTYVSF